VHATRAEALRQGLHYHPEFADVVDDLTLKILERRRRTATIRRRGWLIRRMLLAADLIGLCAAFVVAQLVFPASHAPDHVSGSLEFLTFFFLTLPLWILLAKLYGLYDHDEERTDHSTTDDALGVLHLITLGIWLFFIIGWLTELATPPRAKLFLFWAVAVTAVTVGRAAARALARRQLAYLQNTVIVGAGDVGQLIAKKMLQHPEYGINLVGFVDAAPRERADNLEHLTVLGSPDQLPGIMHLFDVERVIIAFSNESHSETLDLIRSMKDLDVQIDIVPRLFEVVGPKVGIHTVEGIPLVSLPPLRLSRSSRLLKRTLDLVASLAALVLLTPLFAVVGWRIKARSPGPIFFRQVRMGRGDKTFRIFKFRTMTIDADQRKADVAHLNMHAQNGGDPRMFKVPDDPRVTRVGVLLRRYSIDELPQLINVLKGEMSLVGPRPLILAEDQYITDWARKRLDLKPGMTGLWQVLGRSEIPFEEMTKLDYLYVTNWSLWGDLRLLVQTLPALVRARRAY
jgi:exopolysaccharide biosynthesis polyprenyl glycosylphosphotransferase